jgi:hypothetical protein
MFGSLSRCSLCDEKDCTCTKEELERYEKLCKENTKKSSERVIVYSTTEPKVSEEDVIIIENDLQIIVKEIKDGFPWGQVITDSSDNTNIPKAFHSGAAGKVDMPYFKFTCTPEFFFGVEKPPLGLIPKNFHNEKRLNEVREAIIRYCNAELKIPLEWIQEYNELIKIKQK